VIWKVEHSINIMRSKMATEISELLDNAAVFSPPPNIKQPLLSMCEEYCSVTAREERHDFEHTIHVPQSHADERQI
jgi:hypothetical protein